MTIRTPPSYLQNITLVSAGHTAQNDRLTQGALWVPGTTPLSNRSGIVPGPSGGNGEVTVLSNTAVRVQAFRAEIQGTRSSLQGQYTVVNDGVVDLAIGAQASGVVRIDTLMVNVCDTAFSPDTLDTARLIVVPGTAVASNPQPPTLGGANLGNQLVLGSINVPATGGTVTFTPAADLSTVAAGGINPVKVTDAGAGSYDGQYRDRNRKLERWNTALGLWLPQLGGRQVYDAVYQTAPTSMASGAAQWIQLAMGARMVSPPASGGMWSASFPQRLTAPVKGTYVFGGGASFDPDSRGERACRLALNSVSVPIGSAVRVKASDQSATSVPLRTQPVQLNAGDYVELQGLVNLGTTGNLNTAINLTSGEVSSFWGYLFEETV